MLSNGQTEGSYLSVAAIAAFGTVIYSIEMFRGYLNRLKHLIEKEEIKEPYDGLRIIEVLFKDPYILCADYEMIALLVMQLLMKYAYTRVFKYGKFTIGYRMKIPEGDVSIHTRDLLYMIGDAISLNDSNGNALPDMNVYNGIIKQVAKKAEDYEYYLLSGIVLRIYLVDMDEKEIIISTDEINSKILELMNSVLVGSPPEVKSERSKRSYPTHISALKASTKDRRSFIVADTETILINGVHVPYAAGFLVVNPGDDVSIKPDYELESYFSEDTEFYIPEFKDRSNRMLFDFLERLAVVALKEKISNVYFHNFSRFDGILFLKYYACNSDDYSIKPLMRNNKLYKLDVYRNKKRVFSLRDSITLLPSSLATLAKTLCPELGSKGLIAHDELRVSTLKNHRSLLLDYMNQDIRLLGGVMLKAQDI